MQEVSLFRCLVGKRIFGRECPGCFRDGRNTNIAGKERANAGRVARTAGYRAGKGETYTCTLCPPLFLCTTLSKWPPARVLRGSLAFSSFPAVRAIEALERNRVGETAVGEPRSTHRTSIPRTLPILRPRSVGKERADIYARGMLAKRKKRKLREGTVVVRAATNN